MPPFKILTAAHDDGEKPKRFGYKAPTFDAWWEIYLQDEMPDHIVGILLNLDSDEVQETKSCIRHHLRLPAVIINKSDIYYPADGPLPARELLCKQGAPQLGWHLPTSKAATIVRSPVAFAVSLEFPHLFKEPASLREFLGEWVPNAYRCYPVVPCHFRRQILARLIETCAEEMKPQSPVLSAETRR
ncbi:hypothetical protein KCU65_g6343, partial [Aureobasidium melanogenum]